MTLLFSAPALIGLGVFVLYPLGQAVFLAMHTTDISGNPTIPVGFDNFAQLFTADFGSTLLRTGEFTLLVVVGGLVIPMLLAVPLQQKFRGMKAFQVLFTLPFAYSAASASVVWLLVLDPSMSPVNWLLKLVGITAPDWTTSNPWAMLVVAFVTVWVVSGFNLLVLSAGLAGIDEEVLEAAKLDGSVGIRNFFAITLPQVSSSVFFVIVTTTLTALQALGQIQIITDGGPNSATATLVYSIFDQSFHNGNSNYGVASAQGIVLLVIGIAVAAVQFGVIEKRVHYR